jgi:glucose repression regulatory protein TUP1
VSSGGPPGGGYPSFNNGYSGGVPPGTATSIGDQGGIISPSSKKRQVELVSQQQPLGNGGGANQRSTSVNGMQTAAQLGNNLGDLDIEKLPAEMKKIKDDWFVLYNERAPRLLDVDMVQSLDHHSVVCCVRFSADGKYIATGCNRSAQIFDVQTGQLICKLQDDSVERDGDLYIRSVCFSPDGKYLATGAEDKQIRVWDIKSRSIRYLFSGHEQDIYSLDFSRSGRHIASGSGDRTVRMWDMESGQCTLTLSIEDGVTTVAISPDGRYVAAGSLDRTVRVWDTSNGFLVERLEAPDGHKDSVYSVAFTPNGQDLVSGSLDKTLKLWELQAPRGAQSTHKGGVCVKTFVGHKDFVLSVASTPDSQWILSGSKDRGVQFWDPRSAQVQLMLQGHKNSVISVAPSPTGGLFATGSGDCRARIWRYFPVAR